MDSQSGAVNAAMVLSVTLDLRLLTPLVEHAAEEAGVMGHSSTLVLLGHSINIMDLLLHLPVLLVLLVIF